MNRLRLILAICLGCVTLAVLATITVLFMETDGATVIERQVLVVETVVVEIELIVTETPTSTPYTMITYRRAQEAGLVPTFPPTPIQTPPVRISAPSWSEGE